MKQQQEEFQSSMNEKKKQTLKVTTGRLGLHV
jgi:hypothetical protein